MGGRKVIPGFDAGVTGLEVGGTRTQRVTPDQGYGPSFSPLFAFLDVPLWEFCFDNDSAVTGLEAGGMLTQRVPPDQGLWSVGFPFVFPFSWKRFGAFSEMMRQ